MNTYVPVFWLLTIAGDQVPVIPFDDVVGSTGAVPPAQSEVAKLNVGVTFEFTVTFNVVTWAHCPPFGVNVYTADV
jgi:hypothetical protein